MKYNFVVVQREVTIIKKKKNNKEIRTFICIKSDEFDLLIPHPVTEFITEIYGRRNLSLNTLRSYSEDLKKFLNYILKKKLRFNIIKIEIEDGVEYLKEMNQKILEGGISESSLKRAEMVIEEFYYWLANKKIIDSNIIDSRIKRIRHKNEFIPVKQSFFRDLKYGISFAKEPNKRIRNELIHDFPSDRFDNILDFLQIARIVVPEIAFGLCLQFFGGLRAGEVINIKLEDIQRTIEEYDTYFEVNVKENYEEIFAHKANLSHEQVKVERKQVVLCLPVVYEIYKDHIKNRSNIKTENKALFISTYGNKPICGQMYKKKFDKVKKYFLNYKLISDYKLYEYLTENDWSTHFGRGVFTNLLIDDLKWSPSEVRLMRGDKSENTTRIYVDRASVKAKAEQVLDVIPNIMLQENKPVKYYRDLINLLKG